MALHLDCSRTYIGKLEAEGVIQRQGDGFPLDKSRDAYLRYLRRERQQSPRSEADAAHAKAKTELLQIRIEEKKRTLVSRDAHEAMIDQMACIDEARRLVASCGADLGLQRRQLRRSLFFVFGPASLAALAPEHAHGEAPNGVEHPIGELGLSAAPTPGIFPDLQP